VDFRLETITSRLKTQSLFSFVYLVVKKQLSALSDQLSAKSFILYNPVNPVDPVKKTGVRGGGYQSWRSEGE
jgi:hypothetical protein